MAEDSDPAWPALERGRGRTVVFLHGYPLTHEMWRPQLDELSSENHIVLLDLPGYGLAQDTSVPETLDGFAETLHRTLTGRIDGPMVVVGHSFGGYIALELIRQHPEVFEGLVLTNTRSEPDTAEAKERRLATVRRLEDSSQHLDIDEVTRSVLAPGTWATGGPVVDTVRAIVRSVRSAAIVGSLKAIAGRPDLSPVLSLIHVPTLVIWGEEDRLIPPAQSRSMVTGISNCSGVGISGAGHLPSLEAPEAFTRALREFLVGISA